MSRSLNCQSCGAPHDIEIGFAKIIACEFCGAVARLEGNSLTVVGSSATIATGNALFTLGHRGTLAGEEFRVLGRVRYHHAVGVWDEWQLLLAGRAVWLQHDEGELTLFDEERSITDYPAFAEIAVGATITVDSLPLFVAEIGEAVIAGMAGQIPREMAIGQGFFYVDGLADSRALSVEYYFTDVALSLGRPIQRNALKMLD